MPGTSDATLKNSGSGQEFSFSADMVKSVAFAESSGIVIVDLWK